jgi:hypothetical protein
MSMLCNIGIHRYRPRLSYPPTPPEDIVVYLLEEDKCTRCQRVRSKTEWIWSDERNDFEEKE